MKQLTPIFWEGESPTLIRSRQNTHHRCFYNVKVIKKLMLMFCKKHTTFVQQP